MLQVLDDNSLEELGSDTLVPDSLRIHHNDGTSGTNAKTRSFSALDAGRTKKKTLALKQ